MINEYSSWTEILTAYQQDAGKHLTISLSDNSIEDQIRLVDLYTQLAHNAIRLILKKLSDAEKHV